MKRKPIDPLFSTIRTWQNYPIFIDGDREEEREGEGEQKENPTVIISIYHGVNENPDYFNFL